MALLLAATMAAGLLVPVQTRPAEAAFPGANGKKQKNRTNNSLVTVYAPDWQPLVN